MVSFFSRAGIRYSVFERYSKPLEHSNIRTMDMVFEKIVDYRKLGVSTELALVFFGGETTFLDRMGVQIKD